MTDRSSRREFLKIAGGAAVLAPAALEAQGLPSFQDVPPNERLQFATIGFGIQGQSDTRTALRVPGVRIVAVADVYDGRRTLSQELFGSQVFTTRDYREVLALSLIHI